MGRWCTLHLLGSGSIPRVKGDAHIRNLQKSRDFQSLTLNSAVPSRLIVSLPSVVQLDGLNDSAGAKLIHFFSKVVTVRVDGRDFVDASAFSILKSVIKICIWLRRLNHFTPRMINQDFLDPRADDNDFHVKTKIKTKSDGAGECVTVCVRANLGVRGKFNYIRSISIIHFNPAHNYFLFCDNNWFYILWCYSGVQIKPIVFKSGVVKNVSNAVLWSQ